MKEYNHKKIEGKWQKIWEKKKIFSAKDNSKQKKFYSLIEFPYPSGEGLHVGHIRSNTAMDVISRKRRMEGYNVLYPIGWDAFGLPTENYAIKTGIHPTIVTKKNTDTFRRQLKALGFSFDWSREINTTDPKYYKWTQWIFLQLYKHGLAYKKKIPINWCPKDKIGLANEEVIDGKCERCGTQTEKRDKEQWMLAITKYADRLDRDLDEPISNGSGLRILPKKILIGTRNKAKVKMIKEAFGQSIDVEFLSLDDVSVDDSKLIEGEDYRKNAREKANFYFKQTGIPTISTDHIQWIEKYPKDKGFVVHVRKLVNPKSLRASDEEVGKWIENFVDEYGESKSCFYYAVGYADEKGVLDFSVKQKEYILQKEKSLKINEGYPFDRYLKDPKTGEFRIEQSFQDGFGLFADFIKNEFLKNFSLETGKKGLDYLEKIKIQQKNWIGRSEGAILKFKIAESRIGNRESREGIGEIEVFTTRPDTLFGCTYLVLAPEHPLVESLKSEIQNWDETIRYIVQSKKITELERLAENKEKTGVELKGIKAINPANGEEIPVWIADYVLADYGTGAIMAVPAHDERDFAFAKKYNLPIKAVIKPESDFADMDQEKNRKFAEELFTLSKTENFLMVLVGGMARIVSTTGKFGFHSDVDIFIDKIGWDKVKQFLIKKNFKFKETNINGEKGKHSWKNHISFWKDSAGVWLDMFLLEEENGSYFDVITGKKFVWGERDIFEEKILGGVSFLLPKRKMIEDISLNLSSVWHDCFTGNGLLTNSGKFDGMESEEAKWKITEAVGGKKVTTYKLRDWVFSRQHYWGEPIPMVYCDSCAKVKQKVLIIHGFGGSPEMNWMPWMKKELENRGFEVRVPKMSTSEHPDLKQWMKELLPHFKDFGPNDVVIGHSLGSKAALHLILKAKKKIGHLLFVASAIGELSKRDWDRLHEMWKDEDVDALQRFWSVPVDYEKIENYAEKIKILISKGDEAVPLSTHDDIPKSWNFETWDGFGHFTDQKIPELLNWVLNVKNDGWIPVPEKDLPVELPKVEKYQPTDTGESPLSSMTKWVNTKCPRCGGKARRETDTMPNWAGSSWYYLRYIDPKNSKVPFDPKKLAYWSGFSSKLSTYNFQLTTGPVDWYNGGMEHTTLHLLYSRFWHKFLFDIGVVPTFEPYQKRTSHGMILAHDGTKMSKSRPETFVKPDDLINRFGADSLRVYEMFMGPFDQAIAWNTDGLVGTSRFLEKVWRIGERIMNDELGIKENKKLESLVHKTVKKVGEDIEAMRFNTAISSMMICANEMDDAKDVPRELFEMYLKILSPFAPHIAEELWSGLGHPPSRGRYGEASKTLIVAENWPKYDLTKIVDEEVVIVVQINGKVRGQFSASTEISEQDAIEKAKSLPEIKKWLALGSVEGLALSGSSRAESRGVEGTESKPIKKVIFVKGRLVNLVI